jgi:SAM-dependent methyltransferase
MERYFETRLDTKFRKGADLVWGLIARDVTSRLGVPVTTVLDLGAGYGDFINQLEAPEKWAVDSWPGFMNCLHSKVRGIVADITQPLPEVPRDYFDFCFLSNVMEHFSVEDGVKILTQLKAHVRPAGRIAFLQPNFTYCYKTYFDDYTHKTIYTSEGFVNFLKDNGFIVEFCCPRYLPFSFKSRLPRPLWLIRLYLALPFKPLAAQMLIVVRKGS